MKQCERCGKDFKPSTYRSPTGRKEKKLCSYDCTVPPERIELVRFWPKVDKNGPFKIETQCWSRKSAKTDEGYGRMRLPGNKFTYPHRYSYERFVGPIPPGMILMHRCDNPSCVNPEHLKPGTNKDNSEDMRRKGRGAFQNPNWRQKFKAGRKLKTA